MENQTIWWRQGVSYACRTWSTQCQRKYNPHTSRSINRVADLDQRKRPVELKFEIPYFTTSGIQVRYLKIVEPKLQYPALPWVRYITQAGDYALRLGGDQAHVIAPVS